MNRRSLLSLCAVSASCLLFSVFAVTQSSHASQTAAKPASVPCATCHGEGLKGIGDIFPPLAGRSPAATARQLYDFKSGARDGRYAALMKPVVAHLTDQDIVDLTAYIVSLQP